MARRLYQQLKNMYHFFQAHGWRWWYGRPDRGMKIYGVTGTNGKTTTSILLGAILREAWGKEKVGLMTTTVFWVGDEERVNETKMTTMESREVFRLWREMKDRGVEQVVLEVTSHALDQHRLAGISLTGAVITNIAREHLDYHGTMQEYAKAKSKIVSYIKEGGVLVYKADDEWVKKEIVRNPKSEILNPKRKYTAIGFTKGDTGGINTPLAGDWNKENVLAASWLAKNIGIEDSLIQQAVKKVRQVPGRMEFVEIRNPKSEIRKLPRVLIDYAVTPDALERLYKEVGKTTTGRIFGVLGACGERDRGKRPEMARAVASYADELVLTREDPWQEDEEQIFSDLEKGLEENTKHKAQSTLLCPSTWLRTTEGQANKTQNTEHKAPSFVLRLGLGLRKGRQTKHKTQSTIYNTRASHKDFSWRRITDRREAIRYCINKAGPDDVVVVTGKGAETGMAMGKKIIPWNDKQVILELLQEKGAGNLK